jgi:hypothetical protein
MAFKTYVQPHQASPNAPSPGAPRFFLCDAESDLPSSGLNAGDTAYAIYEKTFWKASDATTWVNQNNSKCQLGFGGLVGAATGAMTRYGNSADASLAVDDVSSIIEITSPGILRNLRVTINSALGLGKTINYTVRVNGSDTAITCSISGLTQTQAQDLSNSVAVSAGDEVEIKVSVGAGIPLNVGTRAELEIDWS